MSFFDDASLVMIPSGYKTSKVYSVKPTDGSGDLAFTRSNDTATRVASSGLIEKVRTNLVLYSEQFDNAAWTALQATVSANATTSPIGTTTADKVIPTAVSSFHNVTNSPFLSTGVSYSISVYAKADGYSSVAVGNGFGTRQALFNLTTGVVTSVTSDTTASIVNAGNGWFRCSIAFIASSSTNQLQITVDDGSGSTFVGNGTSGIFLWGAQLETGDIATDYIATTTAAVSVGPVANVSRLDYLGSSCPRLLLEPQRTNVLTYSEQLGNAAWSKYLTTITENNIVSPSGYQDADLATSTAGGDMKNILTLTTSTTYTASFYVKKGTAANAQYRVYNFDAGINVVSATSYISQTSTSTWSRVSFTFTTGATGTSYGIYLLENTSAGTMYFWGAQLEAGAYATSYIPTLGASVTRGADDCLKTGISSLIGQTEGALFVEINSANLESYTQRIFSISDDTNNNVIGIQLTAANEIVFYVENGGVNQVAITKATPAITLGQNVKIAAAYKANDFVLYVNGVQVGTDTSGSVPATSVLRYANPTGTNPYIGKVAQSLLFKTRLSNADLAALTA